MVPSVWVAFDKFMNEHWIPWQRWEGPSSFIFNSISINSSKTLGFSLELVFQMLKMLQAKVVLRCLKKILSMLTEAKFKTTHSTSTV